MDKLIASLKKIPENPDLPETDQNLTIVHRGSGIATTNNSSNNETADGNKSTTSANEKSGVLNAYTAALGVGSKFTAVPEPKSISGAPKVKLQMPTGKAVVAYDDLDPKWQRQMKYGNKFPAQSVLAFYHNKEDSENHMEPLFHAESLAAHAERLHVNKNSLEYTAGRPAFTVDELVKAGDKGVVHRYRFLVIGYDENNKDHVAMKSKGKQIEEYGALIINDEKLLQQAKQEADAIGRELRKSSATNDYYIITPSKNDNNILAKYEILADLIRGVGGSWKDGGYTKTTTKGQLKEGHITQEGMVWKDKCYLRKFDRNDDSLEEWLEKIENNATCYEDIKTDNERLDELLNPEIAQYYLYECTNDNNEVINEDTVHNDGITKESLGTFKDAAKLCVKLGIKGSSSRKKQTIRDKLKEKNLELDGLGPNTRTWAKGKKVAEEAWCVLEVEDSTYLVRGSEL